MLYVFGVVVLLTALAEIGDKTQVIAFALSGRYSPVVVLGATVLVNAPIMLLWVLLGRAVAVLLPEFWQLTLGSAVFVLFGVMSLRLSREDRAAASTDEHALSTTIMLLLAAQLGDKATFLTMAISANPLGPFIALAGSRFAFLGGSMVWAATAVTSMTKLQLILVIWIGSVLGNLLSDGVSVAVGSLLWRIVSRQTVRRLSAVTFMLLGLAGLASAPVLLRP